MTFVAIWEGIVALLRAIPILSRYFPPKTPTEKVEDRAKKTRDEIEEFKRTGRPQG